MSSLANAAAHLNFNDRFSRDEMTSNKMMSNKRVHARRFARNGFLDQSFVEFIFSLAIGLCALPPRHRSRDSIEEWEDVDNAGGWGAETDELRNALQAVNQVRHESTDKKYWTRLDDLLEIRFVSCWTVQTERSRKYHAR